jgi:hypothetical protein
MKRKIKISSLRYRSTSEFVPGPWEINETVIDGKVVKRVSTRTVTRTYELGSTGEDALDWCYSPIRVKCMACGWSGSEKKLMHDGYYDNGCEENDYDYVCESSSEICPNCAQWHCLDKEGRKDVLNSCNETLDEFRKRCKIKRQDLLKERLESTKQKLLKKKRGS